MDGRTDGWMDAWTGWKNSGRTDGWMDLGYWMDGWIYTLSHEIDAPLCIHYE